MNELITKGNLYQIQQPMIHLGYQDSPHRGEFNKVTILWYRGV